MREGSRKSCDGPGRGGNGIKNVAKQNRTPEASGTARKCWGPVERRSPGDHQADEGDIRLSKNKV